MDNMGGLVLFFLGYAVLVIGLYLFYAYCMFLLSKKLDVEYPWMAFVPILNLVNLVLIAGKTIEWGFVIFILPILVFMVAPFTSLFAPSIMGQVSGPIIMGIMYVVLIVGMVMIYHSIATRTGHGKWWTAGLIFASWLFIPVTAFHYEKGDEITPRPFTGTKKFFLIFFAVIFPGLIAILGILAAALLPHFI